MPTKAQRIKRTKRQAMASLVRSTAVSAINVHMPEDLIIRAAAVAPSSLVRSDRMVQSVLATDTAVATYDPFTYEIIDEVLLSRGMEQIDSVPLLRDHNRYSVNAICGAVERIESRDHSVEGWLRFGRDLDPETEGIYRRVEQGFLRTVSAGYAYTRSDSVEIPAGGSATIDGMTFTAGARMMRVVKKWKLREVSLVVIPADELAQLRSANVQRVTAENSQIQFQAPLGRAYSEQSNLEPSMHPLITFLRTLGLASDANNEQLLTFVRSLTSSQRTQANQIAQQSGLPAGLPADLLRSESTSTSPPAQQDSSPAQAATAERSAVAAPAVQTPAAAVPSAADILAQERTRQQTIRLLAGDDIPEILVERALNEGWTLDQVGTQFAQARSAQRPAPLAADNHGQAPFGHVRNNTVTLQALQAGLMLREGVDLQNPVYGRAGGQAMFGRAECQAGWFTDVNRSLAAGQRPSDEGMRALDNGHRFQHWSMIDFGRAVCQLAGINPPDDPSDLFARASTTVQWDALFTTSINALILEGYASRPDPTDPFVRRTDVGNFLPNERVATLKATGMKKDAKNGAEAEASRAGDARRETFSLERFIGSMEYDEKAFINDRFSTIEDYSMSELGQMAAEVAPDLVFGILLGNPVMGDGIALFHASHNNLLAASPLSAANLDVAWATMSRQQENGRNLALFPQNIIVSVAKQWAAEQVVGSQRNVGGTATTPELNPAFNKFRAIGDPRIDNGVIDHAGNGALIAGAPTTTFVAAAGGRHTIEVAYRRGTGRAPRLIAKDLPGARIGKLYMVVIDVMAKALDWKGLLRMDAS